jgi:hypothetical protein
MSLLIGKAGCYGYKDLVVESKTLSIEKNIYKNTVKKSKI